MTNRGIERKKVEIKWVSVDPWITKMGVRGSHGYSMCGFAPTVAVITACSDLGASAGKLIRYTHSGEAGDDDRRVVAYAGIALCS
jgi:AmmeMemoRadiSam system protein B